MLLTAFKAVSFILRHPLNRPHKAAALARFLRWQIASRMQVGAVAVPFVDSTRLLVGRGMTGATGNVYCGLHEFEDMAFVLHALRPGDLFVDVGANVGSYTVLAAGAAGADCVAFEPDPTTFTRLLDNIRLNDLAARAVARNVGVGSSAGVLAFTSGLDTVNHVVTAGEIADNATEIPVVPLDAALAGASPTLLKIDVEGFESEVLSGAAETMQRASLLAVVLELNGAGRRYGYDDGVIHQRMLNCGFLPALYDPFQRTLSVQERPRSTQGTTLYIRDLERIRRRVATAPQHVVLGARL